MATKTAPAAQPEAADTREEGPDAPLLDTLGAELKKLVQKGKERGYVTYDAKSGKVYTMNAEWNTVRGETEPLKIPGSLNMASAEGLRGTVAILHGAALQHLTTGEVIVGSQA